MNHTLVPDWLAYYAGRSSDRVGLLARNSTDHFELMFACWTLGALFMPLNWRLAAAELSAILCDPTHGPRRISPSHSPTA